MPDGLPERLKAETTRLLGRALTPDDRIGIAVSGGADSMALLSLAQLCWPGLVEAATVDHRLRAEARDEAAMVGAWCAAHSVPHAILTCAEPITGNLQASARSARYALLEEWRAQQGLRWLMTAHQADDQIETMLLRLNRGAGVGGLAAVRARRGHILRPLLGERRQTLRDWCEAEDVPFVDDPSNESPRFDRVRMRQALAGTALIEPAGLARSVEALAEADEALAWATQMAATQALRLEEGCAILLPSDLPREILRRLLIRMIAHINPQADNPRGPSLDQALVQLFDGKTVAVADCVASGGTKWTMRRAPPRKSR